MVSIIVPVFNVQSYIDKCLESIVNQTYQELEIVLINDGSTDNSEQICLNWANKDSRIVYISKKNEGQGIARNLGIDISQGEYIVFVDSDDWIPLSAIEDMYNAADKSGADIVMGDIYNVDYVMESEDTIKLSKLRLDKNVLIVPEEDPDVINRARLYSCGKLYRKTIFKKHGIKMPNCFFEDVATVPLLIALSKTIYYIDSPVYYYRRNRSGNTVNNKSALSDILKSLDILKNNFIQYNLTKLYEDTLRKVVFSQIRFVYKKCKQFKLDDTQLLDEILLYLANEYPKLANFNKKIFYINNNNNLLKAVYYVVFEESQVCYTSDNHIDYTVVIDNDNIRSDTKGMVISLNKPINHSLPKDTIYWDLADELFYKL